MMPERSRTAKKKNVTATKRTGQKQHNGWASQEFLCVRERLERFEAQSVMVYERKRDRESSICPAKPSQLDPTRPARIVAHDPFKEIDAPSSCKRYMHDDKGNTKYSREQGDRVGYQSLW